MTHYTNRPHLSVEDEKKLMSPEERSYWKGFDKGMIVGILVTLIFSAFIGFIVFVTTASEIHP